jgi:preprotein translocase subunit SecA
MNLIHRDFDGSLAMKPEEEEQIKTGPGAPETRPPGEKQKPVVRESAKVGRNDPCPCGSGKKYKKCCGRAQAVG